LWGGPTPIPTSFGSKLASFSPASGYPSLDLYRYVYLIRAVQDCLHPFDHRAFEPGLYAHRLLYIALADYLMVADENHVWC
jgi:hypothetical protein